VLTIWAAVAHASLAETLVKLNTGLVAIIASFLNHDQKDAKGHLKLNYKSLTNLSDASRREALQSMTQLYQRLSQSQLHLHQMKALSCARCGSSKHHDCSLKNHSATTSTSEKNRNRHTSSRQRVLGPTIARMPLKSSSHPQLVVIRPKTTRKGSSGSASSSKSPSSSNHASPLASPLPLYIAEEMVEIETAGAIRGVLGGPGPELLAGHGRRRKESFNDIRPSTWPDPYPYHVADPEVFYQHMAPAPKLPTFSPTPRRVSTPQRPTRAPPPPPVSAPPIKRRMDKLTPSSYTFASDSTKLGEIPQRNWTTPWDYEEAERLNNKAAVAATAYAGIHPATVDEKTAKKKGMFRWMRRGSAGA
jgi:hypothetical protein